MGVCADTLVDLYELFSTGTITTQLNTDTLEELTTRLTAGIENKISKLTFDDSNNLLTKTIIAGEETPLRVYLYTANNVPVAATVDNTKVSLFVQSESLLDKTTFNTGRDTLANLLDAIESNTDGLETLLSTISTDVSSIKNHVDEVESSLTTVNTNLSTLITNTDNVESSLSTIGSDVNSIKGYVDGVESSLSTVNTNLSTLITNTDGIESSLSTISADISSIKGYVDGVESSLSTVNTNLSTLITNTDGLESTLSTVSSDIATIKTNVTSIKTNTDDVKTLLDNMNSGKHEQLNYLGGEKIVSNGSATSATIPSGTTVVVIATETGIFYRINGTASADGPGYLPPNTHIRLNVANLSSLSFYASSDGTAYVQYFKYSLAT